MSMLHCTSVYVFTISLEDLYLKTVNLLYVEFTGAGMHTPTNYCNNFEFNYDHTIWFKKLYTVILVHVYVICCIPLS